MPGSNAVKERIERLIAEGQRADDPSQMRAWLVAAQNAVRLVYPSDRDPYSAHAQLLVTQGVNASSAYLSTSEMVALLSRVLEEIEGGLLTTIENQTIAVTFDDFLDHGEEYLKHGRKNEAGVIAGIVFEDTVRRVCRVLGVNEKDVALDTLITELAKQDVFSGLKAKRARAAAGLRTSAAHARWEEIDLSDVAPVIELTRELISARLG
jgi:hypothetical protein